MNILAARIATLEAQGIRFCSLADFPDTHSAYNENTGTLRAYRGRKIGQALNVMAARYARQHGARHISWLDRPVGREGVIIC